MSRVAILVDLGFFLPRYRAIVERRDAAQPHSPRQVARALWQTALKHVHKKSGEQLYRILVYDCKPLEKGAHNPVTGRAVDFRKTDAYRFRVQLHHELVCLRKVALRLGELHDGAQWLLKAEATKRLLKRESRSINSPNMTSCTTRLKKASISSSASTSPLLLTSDWSSGLC